MGYNVDKVLFQTLAAQGAATVPSAWFDLSGYVYGAFYLNLTVGTGTWTPTFNMSPDNGVTNFGAIPTAELAAPAAQTGVGTKRYPLIGVANQVYVQVSSVITVSAVTGTITFIGRTR